jgi:hypothetical protein
MPGIVLNPVANFGFGQGSQPIPPYIPTYDSIYVCSYELYKVSGSVLGATEGGIAKMDFSGSLDTAWNGPANDFPGSGDIKQIRFAQSARDYVLTDARVEISSVTYRQIRLLDKITGTATSASALLGDGGGSIFGMSTDPEEKYVYLFGQPNIKVSTEDTYVGGLARIPHSSIDVDTIFTTNIGDGPTTPPAGSTKFIFDVHVNKNGKIGVVHNGQNWNNIADKYDSFVVLNEDGTVDTSFDFGDSQFNGDNSVSACTWFPSGSSGIWVVVGSFSSFGTSANSGSYNRMMAFNEDGTINQTFTDNYINNGGALNGEVRGIVKIDNTILFHVFGTFTSPHGSAMVQFDYNGFPQAGLNDITGYTNEGIFIPNGVGSGNVYFNGDFISVRDSSNTDDTTKSMNSTGLYDFNFNPNFDIGVGLETISNSAAEAGSIFKG